MAGTSSLLVKTTLATFMGLGGTLLARADEEKVNGNPMVIQQYDVLKGPPGMTGILTPQEFFETKTGQTFLNGLQGFLSGGVTDNTDVIVIAQEEKDPFAFVDENEKFIKEYKRKNDPDAVPAEQTAEKKFTRKKRETVTPESDRDFVTPNTADTETAVVNLGIDGGLAEMPNVCKDTSTEAKAESCIKVISPLVKDIYEQWNNVDLAGRAAKTLFDFSDADMKEKAQRLTHTGSLKAYCNPLYAKNSNTTFYFPTIPQAVAFYGPTISKCASTIGDGIERFPKVETTLTEASLRQLSDYANCLTVREDDCKVKEVAQKSDTDNADAENGTFPEDHTFPDERIDYAGGMVGEFKDAFDAMAEECFGDLSERNERIECLAADHQATRTHAIGLKMQLQRAIELTVNKEHLAMLKLGVKNLDRDCITPLKKPFEGNFDKQFMSTLSKLNKCVQTMHFTAYGDQLGFNLIAQADMGRYDADDRHIRGLRGITDASLTLRAAQKAASPGGTKFDLK